MNFFHLMRMKNLLIVFFICMLLLLLLPVSTVCGQVHIKSTCYNSEAVVTEDVMTNNADYSSVTVLLPYSGYAGLPYSIRSNGAGKSVDEEFSEFSHSIFAATDDDFENIEAHLKTESGEYKWKKGVTASYDGLAMGMSVGCAVENGNLEASYSNSRVTHTEEVMANGAQYAEATVITPNIIASNGAGKSVEEEFSEFSHSTFAANDDDCENIEANLKTESGEYEWKKGVTASSDGLAMGMSVECAVENGNLEASYHNSITTHTEEVTTNGAQYSEATVITPNIIASRGTGIGKSKNNINENSNPGNGSEDEYGGFSHKTRVEGQGKWAGITTNLTCNSTGTEYVWEKGVKTLPQNSSIGMALIGVSKNGSVETLEMDGEASNFPAQHLPPGEVVVTIVRESPISEDLNESIKDFSEEFSESEDPVALFYSIEQECFIGGGGGIHQPLGYDIAEGEYFRLGMSFHIGQKGNG